MQLPEDPLPTAASAEASRALLRTRLQERARRDTALSPLSYGQQALWYLHQRDPSSAAYNVAIPFRIVSGVEVAALRRACQRLVNRHAALRTTHLVRDGQPMQEVHGFMEIPFAFVDATSWTPAQIDADVARRYQEPFDLAAGPVCRAHLLRCADQDHVFLFTVHHIVCDGWSMTLLLDDLKLLYALETQAAPVSPPGIGLTYLQFVDEQRQLLSSPRGAALEAYWHEQLSGAPRSLDLLTDRPRPANQTYGGASFDFSLSVELTDALWELARSVGVTAYTLLLCAFQVLLHRYTREDDILIGSPAIGRDPRFASVVGYFTNPVVLRARLAGNPSFRAAARDAQQVVLGALEHQDYPLPRLVETLRIEREPGRTPLFQVFFSLLDTRTGDPTHEILAGSARSLRVRWGELSIETYHLQQQEGQFDLSLRLVRGGSDLGGTFQYNHDLFHSQTIERMIGHFRTLLQAIVDDPDCSVADLALLTASERQTLVRTWNETDAPYPQDRCLHQLVEEQVARTPDATAFVCGGVRLSYRQLNDKANDLARSLARKGVGPGHYVPVLMDRSLEVPIAFLAIMKAGAAFAPVDMHWPARRIEGILSSMGSQVVLVGETTPRSNGFSHLCTTVSQEALAGMHDGPGVEASTVSPIYLLHTSGSSGEPKGVINIHQGIVNRLCYMTRRFGFQPEDTILQTSSHLFDASVWQLFWPLINGGATVIPGPGRTLNLDEVIELIDRERVSVTDFIPSIFDLLVQQLVQVPTLADRLRSLRQLLIGGEVLNAGSVRQFKALLPRVGITNTYGPTETSIGVIFHEVPADAKNPVPIGRPIDNVRCFILDDRLQLVPVGVAGTLYVGGACLGLGYLGNEQLTNEVFIPNPYPEVGSPRLYNTGDLARYLPDGNVEFLGRADQQVKLHGLRIELSEIEDVLSDFAGVEECAVVLRKQDAGPDRLVAYVVPAGGRALPPDEMRQWLRGHLPLIMVPSAFVMVEALPRLATGKVDRLGLPAPSRDEDAGARALDPPREPLEARLAGIWAEVLGLERVGIHENFFALGGSSLPSIEVVAQAKRAGYDLTPEMVFEYQTVAELAAVVRERSGVDVAALAGHQQVVNAATQTRPVDSPDAPARGNMLIESLGVYLPARAATLAEVVEGCDTKIRFPLGQLTGIRSMPRVEEAEFGLGLARKAILDCLSRSKFEAADIDLLISCSISRCNGPQRFTFEPSMATTLAHELGFSNALTFDVSNACAGLFTGLAVAQAFLRVGAVERALVVSGEYISHLAATAQREIEDRFMDPRLACLTLGDSGAALLLERAETSGVGFHALDLFTLGRYSLSCIAKATDAPHGGAILFNQPLTAAEARNTPAARHALETLSGAGWVPNSGEYVILHQTSGTTLQDVMRDVNKMLRVVALHEDNTINNLAERGNTATTSHFVALMDSIRSGRIKTGDRLVFGISGSGQALGTALYTLDDLPTRIENPEGPTGSVGRTRRRAGRSSGVPGLRTGVAIAGTGTLPQGFGRSESFVDLARAAAERCLNTSSQDRSQIDLVIHAGVYRKDFLSEPAMASIIAGELDINATMDSGYGRRTLAFDISNGPVGYLNACHVAVHMIRAGEAATALVVASEVENNARSFPQELLGVRETGSAMLLRQSPAAGSGFGGFLFKSFLDRFDAYASAATWRHGTVCLDFSRSPQLEDHYLDACSQTIDELLRREGLSLGEVSLVFPPQISAGFISALAQRLGTPRERFIDVTGDEPDLFTSSLPYAFEYVRDHDLIRPDDVGLLVSVGSGLQVGCALYYF